METIRLISRRSEDEDYSSDEESSIVSEVDSDSTSSNDENVDLAFLLVEKDIEEIGVVTFVHEVEKECVSPYEVIEELMQSKVEVSKKQELVTRMISSNILDGEKEKFLKLSRYPNIFITSYEEIKGFEEEELRIELKDGMKLVRQRLRRMDQE